MVRIVSTVVTLSLFIMFTVVGTAQVSTENLWSDISED